MLVTSPTPAGMMIASSLSRQTLSTITQCPPEVTNCPTRPKTVTDTIALYLSILCVSLIQNLQYYEVGAYI
ncbi:hypothetical protein HDV63DRAFT_363544 [Trichoderma sp. SZMC 28014]